METSNSGRETEELSKSEKPPPLVQDAGDQRYDVEEVEIWAEQYVSTSVPAEAMTTWRSVLMMPKSHKRRKEKTSHHPRPVTQQYIKDTKKKVRQGLAATHVPSVTRNWTMEWIG